MLMSKICTLLCYNERYLSKHLKKNNTIPIYLVADCESFFLNSFKTKNYATITSYSIINS